MWKLSYPKNQKICELILVTLLKMQPHYSQSSRENVTPSSGTSPLASYKKYPPPPHHTHHTQTQLQQNKGLYPAQILQMEMNNYI